MLSHSFRQRGWLGLLALAALVLPGGLAVGASAASRIAPDARGGTHAALPAAAPPVVPSTKPYLPDTLCGSLTFASPVTYTASTRPRSATTAYLNSDNNLDLVVTDYSANSVSVFLGNSDGTFQPAAGYGTGVHPVSVAAADFNEDSKLDLVVANYDSANVTILPGNGDGTFQSGTGYSANIGPYGVAVGDFNENTHMDVATSNVNFGTINVMLGNGNGTLQTPVPYSAGLRPQVIATGHFNADSHVDLVVPNYTASTVSVFLGNGNGTFQPASPHTMTAYPDYVTVADLNNDSKDDLVLSHYAATNNIGVALGNGDGTFGAEVTYSTGGNSPTFASVGDFNGDSILDLVSPGYLSDNVSVLLGNGNGTFQPPVSFSVASGSGPVAVLAGDFNHDGRLDMFTANENTNDISVFLNTCSDATATPTTQVGTLTPTPTATVGIATATRTSTPTPSPSPTVAAGTTTATITAIATAITTASVTPTGTATSTSVSPTATSEATATSCPIQFSDVPVGSTFYDYVRCLACRGIVGGYTDGTFRPSNNVTRGQLSKIISNAAGFSDPQPDRMFEDVPVGSTFQIYIGRLASRGYINGYPCGTPGEPCGPGNLPYFRPNANATRGQISKIDSNAAGFSDTPSSQQFEDVAAGSTYYTYTYRLVSRSIMSGYPCGGAGEPCGPGNLPYFRPNANATRGQTSKIVGNTFFPNCSTPAGHEP